MVLKKQTHSANAGMTLLEVILALSFVTIALVAVLNIMQRSFFAQAEGQRVVKAAWLAQAYLEELNALPYAQVISQKRAEVSDYANSAFFEREIIVQAADIANLKQVEVKIYWSTAGGEADVSLQTLRAQSL